MNICRGDAYAPEDESGRLHFVAVSRTLFDVKLQYSFGPKYVLNVDLYNLTNDYTNNDYVHVYGRELFTYAAGSGTAYRIGFTARF